MPDGGNSIGVAPRHGVLQECSVFQLGGGVGCLRRLGGGMEEVSDAENRYTASINKMSAGGSRELWERHRTREFGELQFCGKGGRQLCLVRNDSTISCPQST